MGKCLDDLRASYGRSLTEKEIQDVFEEAQNLWRGVQAGKNASNQRALAMQLAAQKAQREKIAAVIQKRNAFLQLQRRIAIVENVLGNWQGREAEGLEALLVGSQRVRPGSRLSADAIRSGLKGQYIGGFLTDLEKLGKTQSALFRKGALDEDIAKALWTIDNPKSQPFAGMPLAMDIAKIVHKWQEKARLDQNRAGGFIGKEPGYIVRQSHDAWKISRAGFETWKKDVSDLLDWERTGDGAYDPAINPNALADRENFLEQVFNNLATGIHLGSNNPLASGRRVGSTAAKVSQERVLHFKDGESWFKYNGLYGTGNMREALLRGLMRAADNCALMQVLGPSPQANLDGAIRAVRKSLNLRGDYQGARKFHNKIQRIQNDMAELDGSVNIPGNATAAAVGRFTRALQSMAKLGGALISSLSDAPNFAVEMAYNGKSFWGSLARGLTLMARGRGSNDQKRIMSACGVFCDAMCGDILARFSGSDMPGRMSAMMNLFFRMNGLSWWTDSWKKAATLMLSHDLAQIRGLDFDALMPQQRRVFELYGIDSAQWDMLRKGQVAAADGREYLTPEAAFGATDAEIEAWLAGRGMHVTSQRIENFREELAGRLRSLYRDRVQYAVLEPDARTNAILHAGTRPGTLGGELLRFFTQFKSFPTVFLQRSAGRELFGRGIDTWGAALRDIGKGALATALLRNSHGEFSNFAMLFVMTTIFGYLSMTAKQLLAGKNPRPLDDMRTVFAAMVQGGGLGIYGDLLFGERSRMEGSVAGTLGGPTLGSLESAARLYHDILEGRDFNANAFRLFYNHLPGNNLYYVRAVLDYTILNSFYEYLNPGYMQRMRRRVEKENHQTFWHEPALAW